MNEYKGKQIMETSRHQFIYGYNTEKRQNLLSSLERQYPILTDTSRPMAIYMGNFSLPLSEQINDDVEEFTVKRIAREFLEFSISENVMRSIIEAEKINVAGLKTKDLLERINRLYLSKKHPSIRSLEELKEALEASRKAYSNYYIEYLQGDQDWFDIGSLRIPFINAIDLATKMKKVLNNESNFGLIFEENGTMPLVSYQAINSFITKRCNSDISIKVATDILSWHTSYDLAGIKAENIHDYGIVELDSNYSTHTKRLVKKNN